jgi:methionyl-tRNA synthetase
MSDSVFQKQVYVTTPLYYVNAKPHLGHAYSTILADTVSRFYKQNGKQVLFLTGTDEHGEKIAAMAKKQFKKPSDFADEISGEFKSAWQNIGIDFDIFYRTTQADHYALVQNVLQELKDRGEIYFATYEGKYCLGCERFRTDQEWNEQGVCPDHLTPPDVRSEPNYFFKMGAYKERLVEWYKKHPEAIQPAQYMKEVLSFLEQPLEDLSISRPVARLDWGIPLPFDKNYVTYVWFDALLNYLGGLGFDGKNSAKFKKEYWANSLHFVGKDILKAHAIYWPTMLMAMGLEPFKRLHVSGYLMMDGLKMSKSLGNVVSPVEIQEAYGIEPLRYYLLREVSYGNDSSLVWDNFINRANADLANGIGNLASRSLTIAVKNLEGKIPSKQNRNAQDAALLASLHKMPARFVAEFENTKYHQAMAAWAEGVAECDRYINDSKPWALAKEGNKDRLEAVLGTAIDALWTLSVVMSPVLPEGAKALRTALGYTSHAASGARHKARRSPASIPPPREKRFIA